MCRAENYDVKAIAFSDHGHVSVTFSLGQEQSVWRETQSVWQFNNSILDGKYFIKVIEHPVLEMLAGRPVDAPVWECFKIFVATTTKKVSAKQALRNKAEQNPLEESLQTLIKAEDESPGNFVQDVEEVRQQLLFLFEKQCMGALVRSREKRLAHDGKPSKEFRSFERDRYTRLQIGLSAIRGKR